MELTVLQSFPSLELRPEQAVEKAWIRLRLSRFFPRDGDECGQPRPQVLSPTRLAP